MTATQHTAAANESRYASGVSNDYHLASELADYAEQEAEQSETPKPSLTLRKVVTFEGRRRVVREFVGPYQI